MDIGYQAVLTRIDQVTNDQVETLPWKDYGTFLGLLVDVINSDLDNIESQLNELSTRITALGG